MAFAKILIVEDEPIIALDIEQRLLQLGYCVTGIADSAAATWESVEQALPDLVLMDIHLYGELDGIETAVQLRDRLNLPVVFLTAHTDAVTLDRAIATHPFGYIVKPFETYNLRTAIEIALKQHQAERAIQAALVEEQALNELKSRFVSIVSHEFRNPLNVILFAIDLLTQYADQLPAEKKQLYFSRARESVLRMQELLEKVLVIGKTEAGKLECYPNPIDLVAVCQDIIHEAQSNTVSDRVIQFHADRAAQMLCCLDESLVRHILSNLLSNALKYSSPASPIRLAVSATLTTVTFQVQDHGIGIPAADQAHLFDAFHRASNAQTIPGTGLGLSIVKQCVDTHGGKISFQSLINVGTTFTVVLPQSRPESQKIQTE